MNYDPEEYNVRGGLDCFYEFLKVEEFENLKKLVDIKFCVILSILVKTCNMFRNYVTSFD